MERIRRGLLGGPLSRRRIGTSEDLLKVKKLQSGGSFVSERLDRAESARTGSRKPDGDEGDQDEHRGNAEENHRIAGLHAEQKAFKKAAEYERRGDSDGDSGDCESHALLHDHVSHIG